MYFKITGEENCQNWKDFSVELQPYDYKKKKFLPHTLVQAENPRIQFFFLIAEPRNTKELFHVGVVMETDWACEGRNYKYLMVHEFQGKKDKNATIRVHLMNDLDGLKEECQKYID